MKKAIIEGVVGENVKLRRRLQSIEDNKPTIRKLELALAAEKRKVKLLEQRCAARSDKLRTAKADHHAAERELRRSVREWKRATKEANQAAQMFMKQVEKAERQAESANARAEALQEQIARIFESLKGLV